MLRIAIVASAVVMAVVVGNALPASAARLLLNDATGDVVLGESTPAASWPNADLSRVVIRHKRTRISLRAEYAALVKNAESLTLLVMIRTSEGLRRDVYVMASPGSRKGSAWLAKPNTFHAVCPGLRHQIDYSTSTITASFPRACIGSPRWVRVAVGAGAINDDGDVYADDAQRPDMQGAWVWSKKVKVG